MHKHARGPVIVVDDDDDEHELIQNVCTSLGIENPIRKFSDPADVITYLNGSDEVPFVILCDINMPKINGLHLRAILDSDQELRKKSIPFVFLTTTARKSEVDAAYDMTVQGFFEKGEDFETLKERLQLIFNYWKQCQHPNSFK